MEQSEAKPYDLEAELQKIEAAAAGLAKFPPKYIGAHGSKIPDIYWYVIAAMKKTASLAHAFCTLIRAKNALTSAALIRMQLDTGLRVFGLSRVADLDAAGLHLMNDGKYTDLKARTGEKLWDKYLHTELNKAYPGLSAVYDNTSAFVHLSSAHIKTILTPRDGTSVLYFDLKGTDDRLSDEWIADAVEAFQQATDLAIELIEGCLGYLRAHEHPRQPAPRHTRRSRP
jgi:hypothetical protein